MYDWKYIRSINDWFHPIPHHKCNILNKKKVIYWIFLFFMLFNIYHSWWHVWYVSIRSCTCWAKKKKKKKSVKPECLHQAGLVIVEKAKTFKSETKQLDGPLQMQRSSLVLRTDVLLHKWSRKLFSLLDALQGSGSALLCISHQIRQKSTKVTDVT